MQMNWRHPFPGGGFSTASFSELGNEPFAGAPRAAPRQRTRRDRFDYRLIYAVCLTVFFCAALIERCNPFGNASSQARKPFWQSTNEAAHRCASLAMQA